MVRADGGKEATEERDSWLCGVTFGGWQKPAESNDLYVPWESQTRSLGKKSYMPNLALNDTTCLLLIMVEEKILL